MSITFSTEDQTMTEISKKSIRRLKVFAKGQVVIPLSLRKAYHIEIGDQVEISPAEDGLLLRSTSESKKRNSLTDQLFGVFSEYARKKAELDKKHIGASTEKGFCEKWQESTL
jgi:AbrB family looped-hinge helix DNA binding protein